MKRSPKKGRRRMNARKEAEGEEHIVMLMAWEQADDGQRLRARTYGALSRRTPPIDLYADIFSRHG